MSVAQQAALDVRYQAALTQTAAPSFVVPAANATRSGPPPLPPAFSQDPEPFGKGLAFADMHRLVGAEMQQWANAHPNNANGQ